MSGGPDRIRAGVGQALRRAWDRDDVDVTETRRLSGGASRETWCCRVHGPHGIPAQVIVQRQRAGGVRGEDPTGAALLAAADRAGVPVPQVIAASSEDDLLGAPFAVTEFTDGETIPRKILRDEEYGSARAVLGGQVAEALARIHAIPVEPALGLGQPDQLADFEAFLDDLGMAHPALELGLRWLRTNPPTPGRSAVVHGDFRIGNLIVDPEGLAAVIDWELAHVGDPVEDLGWVSMRAWRFGSRLEVGGFAEREEFLDAYEAAAGVSVDRSAVHWWEVMGTFKWGVMAMIQASAHLMGVSRSVELAAIGRRVAETEYDLLRLLP